MCTAGPAGPAAPAAPQRPHGPPAGRRGPLVRDPPAPSLRRGAQQLARPRAPRPPTPRTPRPARTRPAASITPGECCNLYTYHRTCSLRHLCTMVVRLVLLDPSIYSYAGLRQGFLLACGFVVDLVEGCARPWMAPSAPSGWLWHNFSHACMRGTHHPGTTLNRNSLRGGGPIIFPINPRFPIP